jgi:biotin operon repressor
MQLLTPRRRNVLCLRAAGFSQDQIAEALGITRGLVRKDTVAIKRVFGTDHEAGDATLYRTVYALGLLHAGAQPEEVPAYVNALIDQVRMRVAQNTRAESGNDPVTSS